VSFSFVGPDKSGNAIHGDGAPARSAARTGEPEQRGLDGLVSSSTSGTLCSSPIEVDPIQSRLKRMRRRVLTGARLHVSQVSKWRAAFITPSYRSDAEWDPRHISDCLRLARQWLKRRGIRCRYVWVAEIQEKRKAKQPDFHCVHYHIILWLPWGVELPFLDVRGWWPHGLTNMEWARCAVGYVAKYSSKGGNAFALPKGARMYGVGGLEGDALHEAQWWALPGWLRDLVVLGEKVRRRIGGGWVSLDSGELFRSPWRVFFANGRIYIVRNEPIGGVHAALVA
jgi:hypothetical protein